VKKSCYDFAINFCQGRLLLCHSPQRRAPKKLCVLPSPIPPSFCIPPTPATPLALSVQCPQPPTKKKIGKARKGLELVSFLVAHKEKKYFVQLRHSQKITACFRRAKIYTLLFFIIFLNLSI